MMENVALLAVSLTGTAAVLTVDHWPEWARRPLVSTLAVLQRQIERLFAGMEG